jgi:hypothetical protein
LNVKVAVIDAFGGSIQGIRDPLTGYVSLNVLDGRTGIEEKLTVDPNDPKVMGWLKKVFQPMHLDILLGEAKKEGEA